MDNCKHCGLEIDSLELSEELVAAERLSESLQIALDAAAVQIDHLEQALANSRNSSRILTEKNKSGSIYNAYRDHA
ncbi:hypothetical protein KAU11_08260 [Candidatus Babeliales bacterium]|nr:hypothetical protein [Candidatus Babeliales bacterium]